MNAQPLTFLRLLAIGAVLVAATAAWVFLGSTLVVRTESADRQLGSAVDQVWGRAIVQPQPEAWIASPTGARGRRTLRPAASEVTARIDYDPKSRGLLWYRTYAVAFEGRYTIVNTTPIAQTIYVQFRLPQGGSELEGVRFELAGRASGSAPQQGVLTEAVTVPAGGSVPLIVAYRTRGRDDWRYDFGDAERMRDVRVEVLTDFAEIDFPPGGSSPSARQRNDAGGWTLEWRFSDVVAPRPIVLAMPNVLNAGPVAARISFFAPVSLGFFFTVLLILGAVRGVHLHPMNYVFVAAGCFAFQLLFAYLVDVVPVYASFAIAAATSLILTGGYLQLVGGRRLTGFAVPAQFAYMVLFSASFFFDGISGLVIAIGAVVTLAILMVASAGVDWSAKFARRPPPVPVV